MKKIPFSLALLLLFALAQLRAQTLVVDTFYYTGSTQTFVIPQCVSNLTLVLDGAKGGHDPGVASVRAGGSPGGDGGRIYVVISPTPGALLYVNVGGAGQHYFGGWNGGGNGGAGFHSTGGGGGGASDIRIGGNTIANRIFVAGGGGGGGGGSAGSGALNSNSTLNYGGMGGGLGCTSFSNTTQPSCPPALGCGGSAGNSGLLSSCSGLTLTGSGANGGGGGMNSGGGGGTYTTGCSGTSGSLFQGGNGGDSTCTTNYMNKGRFGGGGGGGGYYGGGGGHSSSYNAAQILNWNGGGGGGSTYLNSSYVVSYFTYGWTGMPDEIGRAHV